MAVVFHHTGSPSKTTTAQKERMAARRSHLLSVDSGGGPVRAFGFCVVVTEASLVSADAGDASAAFGGAMLRVFAVNFRASLEMHARARAVSSHHHSTVLVSSTRVAVNVNTGDLGLVFI